MTNVIKIVAIQSVLPNTNRVWGLANPMLRVTTFVYANMFVKQIRANFMSNHVEQSIYLPLGWMCHELN